MKHLLVTNDFPPKVGGIQSYLWELWRRLPADEVTVFTTPHAGAREWDATQPFRVVRAQERVLLPTPGLVHRIEDLAREVGAEMVVLDPAIPVGLIGPRLTLPYVLVLHGAEVTVPGRLPGSQQLLRSTLRSAAHIIAAGGYPLAEAERAANTAMSATVIPPGVDPQRFRPLDADERAAARLSFGWPEEAKVVFGVSRLVPRKGFDTLIKAVARVAVAQPETLCVIAGAGRDERRLREIARRHASPVRFFGRVPESKLPQLYGAADVFAMLCHNRWRGLEQEGFGIVFLEAAAAGIPAIAGRSGGADEAVAPGETGVVLDDPRDVDAASRALGDLLDDPETRARMGRAGRDRVERELTYDVLATRLHRALAGVIG